MIRVIFFLAGCFLWLTPAQAQMLQGTLLEHDSKAPVQGASVFFDGTSLYSVTDEKGRFSLPVKQKINTMLTISHVSYESQSFPYPYSDLPDTLLMTEKTLTFEPVVVSRDVFGRKQKMNVFRRQFLGETRAGKSCKILNEDDIQLVYNIHDNTLYATSEHPVIVSNKYLGYTVGYNLDRFFIKFSRKTLSDKYMLSYYISGASSFIDEVPDDPKITKRRNRTHERSYTRFFRDLIHGKINRDKSSAFQALGKNAKPLNIDERFVISDSLDMHAVRVRFTPEMLYDSVSRDGRKIYGQMQVTFKKYVRSGITCFKPVFLMDGFGNFDTRSGIFFEGDMALQRVGDMLPRDYQPVTVQ